MVKCISVNDTEILKLVEIPRDTSHYCHNQTNLWGLKVMNLFIIKMY